MLFELIAVVVAGFAGAGLAMLLKKLTGGRTPRWLTPIFAGAAMLAVTISNEYSWYPRQSAALQDGLEIVGTVENKAPFRPWTYLVPFTDRFMAVDTGNIRRNPAQPGQLMTELYAFARWQPIQRISIAINCDTGEAADIVPGVTVGEDGAIEGATWRDVGRDSPILAAACGA